MGVGWLFISQCGISTAICTPGPQIEPHDGNPEKEGAGHLPQKVCGGGALMNDGNQGHNLQNRWLVFNVFMVWK